MWFVTLFAVVVSHTCLQGAVNAEVPNWQWLCCILEWTTIHSDVTICFHCCSVGFASSEITTSFFKDLFENMFREVNNTGSEKDCADALWCILVHCQHKGILTKKKHISPSTQNEAIYFFLHSNIHLFYIHLMRQLKFVAGKFNYVFSSVEWLYWLVHHNGIRPKITVCFCACAWQTIIQNKNMDFTGIL